MHLTLALSVTQTSVGQQGSAVVCDCSRYIPSKRAHTTPQIQLLVIDLTRVQRPSALKDHFSAAERIVCYDRFLLWFVSCGSSLSTKKLRTRQEYNFYTFNVNTKLSANIAPGANEVFFGAG